MSAGGYTAQQAARLTGCTPAQLEYWSRAGVVEPEGDAYLFRDLVALRMVRSLLDAGVPLARARRAVVQLVAAGEDLARLRLIAGGDRVWACRDEGEILDALGRGQLALFVAVDRIAAEVDAEVRSFSHERQSFVDALREPSDHPATRP